MKMDPPSLNSGSAFCTVKRVPRTFKSNVLSKCCSVISSQREGLAYAGAREQDVDLALFPFDYVEQPVKVVKIGRVTLVRRLHSVR